MIGTLLAGIAYDPEIRGVLVVVVFGGVLLGSVYLLLSTNIGARLGFQLALTALFGWLMLLGLFWWVYGVGAIGDLPEWRVQEINVGDLSQAELTQARVLLPDNLPDPEQLLADNPDVAAQFEAGDTPTLSEIAALPDLPTEVADQLEGLDEDWSVVPQSELGDPQAAADVALISEELGLYTAAADYVVVGGFEQGGKPDRESDSVVDRVTNRVSNALTVLNPPHYVVLQVQTSESIAVPEGGAPLSPTPDPDEPVVSVILVRDLGTRRLPQAVMCLSFGLLFALNCRLLHNRDRRARQLSTSAAGG